MKAKKDKNDKNETLTTCATAKLMLGYPELITLKNTFLINVATSSATDFYLYLSILLVEMKKKYYRK